MNINRHELSKFRVRVYSCLFVVFFFWTCNLQAEEKLDPAAWGENHAGETLPQLEEGSQCLFCHRGTVGINWDHDHHNKTVRLVEESKGGLEKLKTSGIDLKLFSEILYVLGNERQEVFLKPSKAYGSADMLNIRYDVKAKALSGNEAPGWQEGVFNKSCAGCHATGYDTTVDYYQTLSLDCYTCHGQPPLSHTENPEQAIFSADSKISAREIASICGSCHVREGKSKTTGRPYANNYMPGDNLFKDLELDWSDTAVKKLNPMDRHVVLNVRDIVLYDKTDMTCLTCHGVHKQTNTRHKKLPDGSYCFLCHLGPDTKSGLIDYEIMSRTCGY